MKEDPIRELFKLYVQFHEEVKDDEELEEEGRAWFKKLEEGDEEAVELWNWFRHESLKEFLVFMNFSVWNLLIFKEKLL